MSNHKLCYTIMCNVYKLSTCSSCRQSRWSSLYQCLTFSALWFIRYIKFTLSDKMSSNYHCWRNWDYQVYFNVCRLAFVDCWIWINCDVTATDHSFTPSTPHALSTMVCPLGRWPCTAMWWADFPSPLSLSYTRPFEEAIFWLMSSNPIALFGSSSTAGGFTHATQVNQNDPRSTYWSFPKRQNPTEPGRLGDIQHAQIHHLV